MTDAREGQVNRVRPLWFGSEDRPLFGWLHTPESSLVRGAVVLAPTLGIEAVNARIAYKYLADALADAGFAALRFDYDGTGDSAGRGDDPGRVDAWLRSLRAAIDVARCLGLGRVSVVGMRIGATLAVEVLGSGSASIDDLVLWDPCASGRSFLREQSALWTFALGAERANDGSIETPDVAYSAETVSDLSGRAIATGDGPLASRVLVVMRSGRIGDRRMNERLAVVNAERMEIHGQEDLVEVQPHAAKVPEKTVATIVAWLAGTGPTARVPLDVDAVGRNSASLEAMQRGKKVHEHAVSIGPVGLFGIMTSPLPAPVGGGVGHADPSEVGETPTVFFFNAGVIDHVGPARLWVDLARQWAAAGIPSIRFDLSGIGDSPVRDGQRPQGVYTSQARNDVTEVLRAVLPTDPSNAVLVGLCSGAYFAIEEGILAKVRGVCAINPILTFKLPTHGGDVPDGLPTGEGRVEVTGGMKGWVQNMPGYQRLNLVVQRLPSSFWWIINRVAAENIPVRKLADVVNAGANVLIIAGTKEGRWLVGGEGRTVRKLVGTGRFHMQVIPGLEHTLFERRTREMAAGMLTEHVIRNFGPSSSR